MLSSTEKVTLMRAALDEARRGMAAGEVPIGSVIARGSGSTLRVIARGHNRVNALQRKVAHAEMIAFENAGKHEKDRPPLLPLDAEDAILISTLEPCVMCLGAAMEAGIKTVIFGLEAPADNGTQRVRPPESPESSTPSIIGGILAEDSRQLFEFWLAKNQETEQAKFVRQLLVLTSSK